MKHQQCSPLATAPEQRFRRAAIPGWLQPHRGKGAPPRLYLGGILLLWRRRVWRRRATSSINFATARPLRTDQRLSRGRSPAGCANGAAEISSQLRRQSRMPRPEHGWSALPQPLLTHNSVPVPVVTTHQRRNHSALRRRAPPARPASRVEFQRRSPGPRRRHGVGSNYASCSTRSMLTRTMGCCPGDHEAASVRSGRRLTRGSERTRGKFDA